MHYKVRIRCKLFFKSHPFYYWFITFPGWHKIIFCIPSITFVKSINLTRIPLTRISFVIFLYGSLNMYAHANDIHENDILSCFQVHIHQPKKMLVLFCLCHLKPKPSPCILHNDHRSYDECVYLFLWPVPQSIYRRYSKILYHHHKIPTQTSLRYGWIYRLNR